MFSDLPVIKLYPVRVEGRLTAFITADSFCCLKIKLGQFRSRDNTNCNTLKHNVINSVHADVRDH